MGCLVVMKFTQNAVRMIKLCCLIGLMFFYTSMAFGEKIESSPVVRYNLSASESWVPYGYFGNSARPGIFAEVLKAVLKRANISYEFYSYPPKRAQKAFDEGKLDIDFMSPEWFKNGDMGSKNVYSTGILDLSEYIVTLPENASVYSTPDSIYGKRIGTIAGYSYHDDDEFIRVDFLSESALIEGLKKQRFKAVILEGVTAAYWSEVHNVPIAYASIHSQGEIVMRLRKELDFLLPQLNSAIHALKDEGVIEKIIKRYQVQ